MTGSLNRSFWSSCGKGLRRDKIREAVRTGLPPAILGLREAVMISQERKEYLLDLWFEETNEDWTQVWRNELNQEERVLVSLWDSGYSENICCVLERTLKAGME